MTAFKNLDKETVGMTGRRFQSCWEAVAEAGSDLNIFNVQLSYIEPLDKQRKTRWYIKI